MTIKFAVIEPILFILIPILSNLSTGNGDDGAFEPQMELLM